MIFDGDNTLWNVEALYDDARIRLCDALAERGAPRLEVEGFQRQRDRELYDALGYSPERFPRSFVETARHFIPTLDARTLRLVEELAQTVFHEIPSAREDVDAVLTALSARHDLVLFTAGDQKIQRERVLAFGRAHHFSHVRIIPKKNAAAFRALVSELRLDPLRTWMVGDSLNSDILPAVEVGLRAIYFKAVNWSPVEQANAILPLHVPTAHGLIDLLNLIDTGKLIKDS